MIYDIVILIILLVFLIIGLSKGAAKTLLSLMAVVLAGVVSILMAKFLSQFIFDAFIRASLESKISDVLTNSPMGSVAQTTADVLSVIPSFIVSVMAFFGVSQTSFESYCSDTIAEKGNLAAESITEAIMPTITGLIGIVLCVILFVLLCFLLKKIAKVISKIFRLPLIRVVDSILGGVLGLAEGFVVVTLLVVLWNLLIPLFPADWTFVSQEYIDTSHLFGFISNGGIVDLVRNFTYSTDKIINL
ncbi:MAG: hypothetical protein E7563_00195 [Ruminococcaceae bacterium]|nr:hypothetical protein [Oscillospiraceae bacterium]